MEPGEEDRERVWSTGGFKETVNVRHGSLLSDLGVRPIGPP